MAVNARSGISKIRNTPRVRVLRTLHAWISEGKLPAGERFPPQEELAAQFGVSRMVIRSALQELEAEGLVERGERRARLIRGPTPAAAAAGVLTDVVGLVSRTPIADTIIDDPTYPAPGWSYYVQVGARLALQERGLHILSLNPDSLAASHVERLAAGGLRGAVLFELSLPAGELWRLGQQLQAAGLAVVTNAHTDELAEFDRVVSDQRAGCRELTNWLIRRGCRRILRYWSVEQPVPLAWLAERDAGHEEALRAAGLMPLAVVTPPNPAIALPDARQNFEHHVRLATGYLLDHLRRDPSPDAIMTASDGAAYAVAAACRLLGREPNRDIAIVGYDNYWHDCPEKHLEPTRPLATVDKRNREIGRAMVELLEQRHAGQLPPGPQLRTIAPSLVEIPPDPK